MRHPTADSSWFTFETSAASGFRVYAFSGVEEMHRPYEFEIELVHDLDSLDFATLLGRTACLSIRDKSSACGMCTASSTASCSCTPTTSAPTTAAGSYNFCGS
jgi:uncharacterized protein involved in type VI secretion and phage assembly